SRWTCRRSVLPGAPVRQGTPLRAPLRAARLRPATPGRRGPRPPAAAASATVHQAVPASSCVSHPASRKQRIGKPFQRDLDLLTAEQVLERRHAARDLVLAAHHHVADAGAVRVLELLAELARFEL